MQALREKSAGQACNTDQIDMTDDRGNRHISQKTKILPLTSARFFAAIYVVLYHTLEYSGIKRPLYVDRALSLGETSVSFFFVLSGYILASVYLAKGKTVDKRRFWWARFARIYPIYMLMLLLDAPHLLRIRTATYGLHEALWKTGLTLTGNIFLLQGWFRQLAGINNPSWSISAESFFYLLFPFVGAYIWRLRRRSAVYVAALIYLFSVLLILLLEQSHLSKNWWYYFPLARTGEFLVGITVAKVHLGLIASNGNTKFLRRILSFSLFAASICFVGVLVSHLSLMTALPQTVLFVPLHAVIIAALASDPPVIRTVASQPLLVLLGEASYGLYIIHIPLWNLFGEMGLTNKPILYLVFLGTAIVLSVISFKFFETPLRSSILKSTGGKDREGLVSSSIAQ